MRDLGYNYIVLDDCWSAGRNAEGKLQANITKFPSGMKNVASRMHTLSLKFGMYSSAGVYTCALYGGVANIETFDSITKYR